MNEYNANNKTKHNNDKTKNKQKKKEVSKPKLEILFNLFMAYFRVSRSLYIYIYLSIYYIVYAYSKVGSIFSRVATGTLLTATIMIVLFIKKC